MMREADVPQAVWGAGLSAYRPSNETLLLISLVSFLGFAVIQTAAAIIASSVALLGDSAAMAVDALSYGFNLYAERKKVEIRATEDELSHAEDIRDNESDGGGDFADIHADLRTVDEEESTERGGKQSERALMRRRRKIDAKRKILYLESIPPAISVSILIAVVIFIMADAISTLIADANSPSIHDTNLRIAFTFAMLNLLLDVVNIGCFARADHLTGYATTEPETHLVDTVGGMLELEEPLLSHPVASQEDATATGTEGTVLEDRTNMNMCSAYTHVFADTMRSVAIILAAIVAEIVDGVAPGRADAGAAIAVSIVILLLLIPLFQGLVRIRGELRELQRELHIEKIYEEIKEGLVADGVRMID